jgi:hypothetical protein
MLPKLRGLIRITIKGEKEEEEKEKKENIGRKRLGS